MSLYYVLIPFCLLSALILPAQVTPVPKPDTVLADGRIFTSVEVEAGFPGGESAWRKYLQKNLNPNVPADNAAPIGKYTVIVKFAISPDGSLSDISTETSLGYGMEKEVLRIIQKSGNWSPAIKDGKPIKAYRRQPVTFQLGVDGVEITSEVPFTIFTGTDNIIDVNIRRVKNSNLTLTISKGTITPTEDGRFIARVNEPGRITITVNNKKNNSEVGIASFEVKAKK
jgi:TonB family protein